MRLFKFCGLAILALSISLVSCSDGEDGTNGINGIDGVDGLDGIDGQDGANGQDGTDGQNGQNGAGYDELAQYGYISMTLSGTRPDDVPFEDESTFKFIDGNNMSEGSNEYSIAEQPDQILYDFSALRFLTVPDNTYNNSWVGFFLVFSNIGETDEEVLLASYAIIDYAIIGEDNKFFIINNEFGSGMNGTSEFEFTDLAFEDETGHLTFSYSFTIDGANNSSGNELTVSGEADLYLLEEIQ